MIDINLVIGFATASFAIAISPGPSWIYVISSTVEQGYIAGLIAVAGNATGIIWHVTMATLGLSVILQYSATVFIIIKWIGVAYLIFLAGRIIRTDISFAAKNNSKCRHLKRVFRDGVLVNMLNPKVSLLMFALLPQFVNPSNGMIKHQIAFLGIFHIFIASIVLTIIVFLTNIMLGSFNHSKNLQRFFRWGSGTLLFCSAIKLALLKST